MDMYPTLDKDSVQKIKQFAKMILDKKEGFFFVYNQRDDALDLCQP